MAEGENQTVLSESSKALLNPDFEKSVSLIKAKAEESLGNQDKADKIYKKLLSFKETRLAALDGLIRSKVSSGDLITALELAKRLIILKPKSIHSLIFWLQYIFYFSLNQFQFHSQNEVENIFYYYLNHI